jgi:tetratricopeptide (TPR) repeat protein
MAEARAERWLSSIGSPRAFLFLHLYEPHKPYAPPERFAEFGPYDGEIAYADEIVGTLVHYLKSHQLYDRATIVLLSDHGEGLGDHGEQEHGLFLYDEAIHVPVTTERYRYIKAPRDELYDLQHDRGEDMNLAPERPQVRQALRRALDRVTDGTTIHAPAALPADTRERLQALGYIATGSGLSAGSGADLPDPKDRHHILETYRTAIDLAAEGKWAAAIGRLQQILREDPGMADVWSHLAAFATRADRLDLAVDAFRRYIELKPSDPGGHLGAAGTLLKQRRLDDAREHAQLAVELAGPDARARAEAHEMQARIALVRHDGDAARCEAALAREADPKLPLPAYVEARLLYDQGKYEEALPLFLEAVAQQEKSRGTPLSDLHYHTADTLGRLEKYPEAEAHFKLEIQTFPRNARTRAGLAMLYQATDRSDEADQVLAEMLRVIPTPESYALAARVWSMSGNRQQADAVRAEARRTFGEGSRGAGRH